MSPRNGQTPAPLANNAVFPAWSYLIWNDLKISVEGILSLHTDHRNKLASFFKSCARSTILATKENLHIDNTPGHPGFRCFWETCKAVWVDLLSRRRWA